MNSPVTPSPPSENAEKRHFLKQVLVGVGLAYSFAPFYAVWRYLVSPSERRTRAAPLTFDAALLNPSNYAIVRFGDKNVHIRRGENGGLRALNMRCTHAGCMVEWQNTAQKFVCHCHGAEFHADGSVAKLPATEPLEELTLNIDSNADRITLFDDAKPR
ncbi:MAG: Rieske 2Fe-2S domain-containing protein [Candidatus Kapaibacteriota bacterium]